MRSNQADQSSSLPADSRSEQPRVCIPAPGAEDLIRTPVLNVRYLVMGDRRLVIGRQWLAWQPSDDLRLPQSA
jgi:hypothetical protein